MKRKFNDVGLCVPHRHYMVDISTKIEQIMHIVEAGEYFTINRPRQFGKTTTLRLLQHHLKQTGNYLPVSISFEGIGIDSYKDEPSFIEALLITLHKGLRIYKEEKLLNLFENKADITKFSYLDDWLTNLVNAIDKPVVLMIDEVDKSSDNQRFLDFLGLLRNKYLDTVDGSDKTFHSVILAGVHDIKTLKAKLRPDDTRKYNSPWNIAVDFKIDLSFAANEIETMLQAYSQDKAIHMDIPAIAEKLYYYTSGYPYLVSKLCKFIDEEIMPPQMPQDWSVDEVDAAFRLIVSGSYTTTLFESLIKNLENNQSLYDTVFNLVIRGKQIPFDIQAPVINLGYLYGIFKNGPQGCQIHNRIYEQRIYSYMMTKLLTEQPQPWVSLQPGYYIDDGLNIKLILQKFQAFIKEHTSHKDTQFLEREGRLLFLSHLRPIINGKGFDFKEPHVGDERRMDIVVTYQSKRYVIELKIWRGPKYHQAGLKQLSDYLDTYSLKQGYLLIYDFSQNKTYKEETITVEDKQIFAVWV